MLDGLFNVEIKRDGVVVSVGYAEVDQLLELLAKDCLPP